MVEDDPYLRDIFFRGRQSEMTDLEKAAEEFKVPEDALPPRNKSEQDIMFAYMRGRKEGFLAGAEYARKQAEERGAREMHKMIKTTHGVMAVEDEAIRLWRERKNDT